MGKLKKEDGINLIKACSQFTQKILTEVDNAMNDTRKITLLDALIISNELTETTMNILSTYVED